MKELEDGKNYNTESAKLKQSDDLGYKLSLGAGFCLGRFAGSGGRWLKGGKEL